MHVGDFSDILKIVKKRIHCNRNTKMAKTLIILFLSVTYSAMCQSKSIFLSVSNQDSVTIYLKNYSLKDIPKEIATLQRAKVLVIAPDTIPTGWTIYPPHRAFDEQIDKPPFLKLPDEITTLTNLRDLTLTQLCIQKLPVEFERLEKLEKLDLSINKLTIKNEINILVKLRELKELVLFGNRVTKDDILKLKKANPSLHIDLEELFMHKIE